MQYVNIKWASLRAHKMESWRILPAEKRQQFLLLHSALMTTLILSATRQNFSHFRAYCVNAEFHQLHIGSAEKISLCSSEASFCLLFHYFLQVFSEVKNGTTLQHNLQQMLIHLDTLMPGTFLKSTGIEVVIS